MAIEGIDPYAPQVTVPTSNPEQSSPPQPQPEQISEEDTGTNIDTTA